MGKKIFSEKIFFHFLIFISALIFSIFLVEAHSLYLFGISLDFDKELKSNVIKTAQKFLNTDKEPINFDLDKGLIIAHFEPDINKDINNYVEVNPLGYTIQGMRNENLKHKEGTKKLTKEQGFEIAKKFFEKFPDKIRNELKYDAEVSEVDNTYFYKWFRYVNGILVAGEDLSINVDAVNGSIIAWRLAIFHFPKETMDITPAISRNVAKLAAELSFSVPSVKNFEPFLIVQGNQPVWVNKLRGQLYPYFAGVNAKDGSIAFSGTLPGDVPKDYNAGSQIQVVETDFIKQIYNSK